MNWYYREESGLQIGPLTEEEFDDQVKLGKVSKETMVWNESMHGWQSYEDWNRQSVIGIDAPPVPQVVCSQCFRQYPENELLKYQDSWVCASCKPLFFQKLKEGGVVPGRLEYANFWPRFGAKLIDSIIMNVVSGIVQFGLLIPAFVLTGNEAVQGGVTVLGYLLSIALNMTYSVYFLVKYQATPGKMALGLKVVTAEGQPITKGTAFGRFFAELLSAMTCLIGYIMAAFDDERRTLHDRLCNTRVVRK
ncbi:MAG TPA: RDD family protein [Acidobacteriota bacterium]|nr:RDD family protein [Acidobacteriota bacterium]